MTVRLLKTVIFYGSARDITPPWGGDTRLGDRVHKWVNNHLEGRIGKVGSERVKHEVTILDPLVIFSGSYPGLSGEMRKPTFFMGKDHLTEEITQLQKKIADADCYIIISPEYNHVVPPALASLMGHFGGSLYKCKPSGIVTYSPGPYGGMRAAMSIVTMCHELGCLPVSTLCGLCAAHELLNKDGSPVDPENRMLKQLPQLLDQLEWMAVAMKNQRDAIGTYWGEGPVLCSARVRE